MRAMRAESFTGYGALKLVEVPRPLVTDGRILVRITAAGVSPLDHTILSGGFPFATPPLILGNEGAGVVESPVTRPFQQAPASCSSVLTASPRTEPTASRSPCAARTSA